MQTEDENIRIVAEPSDPHYAAMVMVDKAVRQAFSGVAHELGTVRPGTIMELMAAAMGRLYAQAAYLNNELPFPTKEGWDPGAVEISRIAKTFEINADNTRPWKEMAERVRAGKAH